MTDKELYREAVKAMENAYTPFSHFNVGAAILTEDGEVFTGCNIDNLCRAHCLRQSSF